MKKTFLVITCVFSLCLVSCASKDAPVDNFIPETPEISNELDFSENTVLPENTESDAYNDVDSEDKESGIEESVESDESSTEIELEETDKDEYILEDIEEPVVITLEPEMVQEEEPEAVEIPAEPEPIEVENPPEIEVTEIIENTDENIQIEESNNQNDNDDVIDINNENEDDVISLDDQDTIDITDENPEDSMDSEMVKEEIIPSRKVTLKKQEYVDIVYPGNGWVYMGTTDGSKDLSYFGRKLGTSDTKFTLQARNAGTKIVHFYKNDALTNQYLDDYIEIEVLPEKGSNKTHIEAPAYKQPVPKKAKEFFMKQEKQNETTVESESANNLENELKNEDNIPNKNNILENITPPPSPAGKTVSIEEDEKKSEDMILEKQEIEKPDTDVLLKEAELLYNEKEYKSALDKLDKFFEYATSKRDKGLYLQGQILETKSEIQNIKAAMEAYTTLKKNYPASKYWDDANKRIIYLKRFYFGG